VQGRPLVARSRVGFVGTAKRPVPPRLLSPDSRENTPARSPRVLLGAARPCAPWRAQAACAARRGGGGASLRLGAAPVQEHGEPVLGDLPSEDLGPGPLRSGPPRPWTGWPLTSGRPTSRPAAGPGSWLRCRMADVAAALERSWPRWLEAKVATGWCSILMLRGAAGARLRHCMGKLGRVEGFCEARWEKRLPQRQGVGRAGRHVRGTYFSATPPTSSARWRRSAYRAMRGKGDRSRC